MSDQTSCTVCGGPRLALGLCRSHYEQASRTGKRGRLGRLLLSAAVVRALCEAARPEGLTPEALAARLLSEWYRTTA